MRRAALLVLVLGACTSPPPTAPAVPPCVPAIDPAGGPPPVWGFADLHTHPAIAVGFDGTQLVWSESQREPDLRPDRIPVPDPCPVETHAESGTGPFDRTAHTLILPLLNGQAFFPHGPVAAGSSGRRATAWPNARDVLHDGMDVGSIRRAYEGGLRLLFASVTDSQVLASLLRGPAFAEGFHPDQAREREAATVQLRAIQRLVDEQSSWMRIVSTPEDARAAIGQGLLAVVLSLEMDGLDLDDMTALIDEFGVAHVLPIHLVDNQAGGTALTGPVFNAATALLSEVLGRERFRFIHVEQTELYTERLPWPIHLVPRDPPVLFDIHEIPYTWYAQLGYESSCACDTGSTTIARRTGHVNTLGLSDAGDATVRALMRRGVMVDLSHMSALAADATVAIAESTGGYPLVASHGGIGPISGPGSSERALSRGLARRLRDLGGLVGLGTGGRYDTSPLLVARGGPLSTSTRADQRGGGCAVRDGIASECSAGLPSPVLDPGAPLTAIDVALRGSVPAFGAARLFATISLDDPTGASVGTSITAPVTCSGAECTAHVAIPSAIPPADAATAAMCPIPTSIPTTFTVADLASVTLSWSVSTGELRCSAAGAPSLAIERFEVRGDGTSPIASGAGGAAGWGTLSAARGAITLFDAGDRPAATPIATPLVRISMTSAADGPELNGAGVARYGANVCVALRTLACDAMGTCACPPPAPLAAGAFECDGAWIPLSHRGTWPSGTRYDTFLRLPDAVDAETICGLDWQILDWADGPGAFGVDEIRVDRITDPVASFASDYRDAMGDLFGNEAGHVAFGTDFDGLYPQLPISTHDATGDPLTAWGCSSRALAPLRPRGPDGDGAAIRLSERGLASFGMIADVTSVLAGHHGCEAERDAVVQSLMLSAEATLRAWERARAIAAGGSAPLRPLPILDPSCGGVP